jgi:hypothetical protein
MAASGVHWRAIGGYLTGENVPGPYGWRVYRIVTNVKNVITNPVYKGEARSGEFVDADRRTEALRHRRHCGNRPITSATPPQLAARREHCSLGLSGAPVAST